ncbi:unnamed protein product, partial [Sphagnum compactum]
SQGGLEDKVKRATFLFLKVRSSQGEIGDKIKHHTHCFNFERGEEARTVSLGDKIIKRHIYHLNL